MKQLVAVLLILAFSVGSVMSQQPAKIVDGNRVETFIGSSGRSYDSTLTTLANSLTALTTDTVWVQVIHCVNIHATDAVTLTLTNTAGTKYFNALSVPVNGVATANYNARGIRMVGIKWNANTASSMNCQITGVSE